MKKMRLERQILESYALDLWESSSSIGGVCDEPQIHGCRFQGHTAFNTKTHL
jgi:hypothetical protein